MQAEITYPESEGDRTAQRVALYTIGMIACKAAGIDAAGIREIGETIANDAAKITVSGASAADEAAAQEAFKASITHTFERIAKLLS